MHFLKVGAFPELAGHWYSRPTVAEVITTNTSVGEIYLCLVAPEDVRNPSAASLLGQLMRPLTLSCDHFWNPKKFPFSRVKLLTQPCTAQLVGIISQTKEYNSETIEVRYPLCDLMTSTVM
jgi:hypothetical protein